jgi:energy-coupling factor transporter ATP-binding protein EcfA2
MKLFKRFNDVGVTVVIATHDVHLIEQFGARRIVLGREGRVADPAAAQAPRTSLPGTGDAGNVSSLFRAARADLCSARSAASSSIRLHR